MPTVDTFAVQGVDEAIANLHKINGAVAMPAIATGMKKGMAVLRKGIRQELPHKSIRDTVSSKFLRSRGHTAVWAKVGASVGKPQAGITKGNSVKITKENAHWYFIGTGPRWQWTTGKYVGAMWNKKRNPDAVLKAFAKLKGAYGRVCINEMNKAFLKKMKQRIKTKGFRAAFGTSARSKNVFQSSGPKGSSFRTAKVRG